MTRLEIRKRYGISALETSSIANEELTENDAKLYENFIKAMSNKLKKMRNDSIN